jgi:hypothetical protein
MHPLSPYQIMMVVINFTTIITTIMSTTVFLIMNF